MSEVVESFVQGVEVWVPDGDLLQRQSWVYKRDSGIDQVATETTLQKGQGLPGLAWSTGQPEVWHRVGELRSPRVPGLKTLDAALALPIYRGNEMVAIVDILCGSRARTGGCIEVWEPNEFEQLVHVDGYYGRLKDFEDLSRAMRFVRGEGLPGTTWERGRPRIIADLGSSSSFMRAAAARENDVRSGLGLPVFRGDSVSHVLLFLSTHETPLARAFEVWTPDFDGVLRLEQSYYGPGLDSFAEASRLTAFAPGAGLPGRVFASSIPCVVDCSSADAFARHARARQAGLEFALALPIHDGRGVCSVVLLLG